MKDKMDEIAIEEFVGLKPKIYSVVVSDSNAYKKVKSVYKKVTKINHIEYRNVSHKKKFIRQSKNRIRSKIHKI